MRVALLLLLAGALLLGGYAAYLMVRFILLGPTVLLLLRIGLAVFVLGLLVGLIAALGDRLRGRGKGEKRDDEEAEP
ncbi:MAG: hypothetical protein HY688_04340 [Chloroflexi bacterium]|nr:hypothetical protein [Chloroflexota bacterium]